MKPLTLKAAKARAKAIDRSENLAIARALRATKRLQRVCPHDVPEYYRFEPPTCGVCGKVCK